MKRILLMTVGTGIGSNKEERIKSLAHGLLASIKSRRPEHIIFFVSDESKDTVESLKIQYEEENNGTLEDYEYVELNDINSFDDCFNSFKEIILKYDGEDVELDYTSGTKTMTMALAICSMLYRKKLIFVDGQRQNGLVVSGTESVKEQNLYNAYDKLSLDKFKELFDEYRFKAASNVLNEIVIIENKSSYCNLVQCYDHWDKFQHNSINIDNFHDYFKSFPEIKTQLEKNIRALKKIMNKNKESPDYILADLLNNARRRIEERKFDDAVARLYRSVELIAQIKLKNLGLIDEKIFDERNAFYIDKEKLKNKFIKIHENESTAKNVLNEYVKKDFSTKNEMSYFKLASNNVYRLLSDLNVKLAKDYLKDKEFKSLLSNRNDSILAHGLKSVEEEKARALLDKVLKYSEDLQPNIELYMDSTKFPKFGETN